MGFILTIILIILQGSIQDRIPVQAKAFKVLVRNEYRRAFGLDAPIDAVTVGAGTIHQESAWNPRARSPYAEGLTQFTPATFEDALRWDPTIHQLGDVWNAHASVRAMAIYHARLWKIVPPTVTELDHWAFVTSSYNGGLRNLQKDVRLCTTIAMCDPKRWWGHVEKRSGRAPQFFIENRNYPFLVIYRWRVLYQQAGW